MVHNVGQLGAELFKVGKHISEVPTKNVMSMARVTQEEIVRSQPRGVKQFDKRQLYIKRPRQKNGKAFTFVAGGGLVVIAEHGSYRRPYGWTIYPKAFTVAGGKKQKSVRYVGRQRIDEVALTLANRERYGIKKPIGRKLENLMGRTQRTVLAFGAPNASRFSAKSKHAPIGPKHFVARATARASEQSGRVVGKQIGKILQEIR